MTAASDFKATRACAEALDATDPLRELRDEFHFPLDDHGAPVVYLCGNSLGLQSKRAARYVAEELEDWARLGVGGHFHARRPWLPYHREAASGLAALCGAEEREVVAMNTLTVNLHLLMASFYRPTTERHKIVIESLAFPSDRFACESQLRFHGFDPATGLLEWAPRDGEQELKIEDLESLLERHGDQIALLMLPGVQYYSGQVLDMAALARLARAAGIPIGFDLAHAIGNVPLALHHWEPDFATWCSYKYLNGGPGAVAGAFVHARHLGGDASRTLLGWWGNREETRFQMRPEFEPEQTAELWQLSNPPILSLAPVVASLELFADVGIEALHAKSRRLTGFLEFLLREELAGRVRSLTPADARGCQMSLSIDAPDPRAVFDRLGDLHVVVDWRQPHAIRVAPAPMYNSYHDVFEFVERLKRALRS